MNKIAELVRAVMAALGRMVSRLVTVTKIVGGKLILTTETVTERVFDAAAATPRFAAELLGATSKLALGAVSDVVKAPFRIAGMAARAVMGNRAPEQAPQDAAAQAEQAAEAQVARSDAADDARQVLTSLRQVAAARAVGQTPDPAHVGRLPHRLLRYVEALDAAGCDALARKPTGELRAIIGANSGEKVASEQEAADADRQRSADDDGPQAVIEPVVDLDAQRAARRAQLRNAVRGAMRGQTQAEVAAEAWAAAPSR